MTSLALVSALLAAVAFTGPRPLAPARLRRLARGSSPAGSRTGPGGRLHRLNRLNRSRRVRLERAAGEELALLVDLLGAALAAGSPLATALDAVDRAVPAPRHHPLGHVRDIALSGSMDGLRDTDDVPAVLSRALRRSGRSGARLAVQLRLLADDVRAESAAVALDRARRVGVLAVLPLGLCCLPAFMLLAVVPLAAGLLQSTLA